MGFLGVPLVNGGSDRGFMGVYGGFMGFYGVLWGFIGFYGGRVGVFDGFPRGTLGKWGSGGIG